MAAAALRWAAWLAAAAAGPYGGGLAAEAAAGGWAGLGPATARRVGRMAAMALFFAVLHALGEVGPLSGAVRRFLAGYGVGRRGAFLEHKERGQLGLGNRPDEAASGTEAMEAGKALDLAVHDCATRLTTAVHNALACALAVATLMDPQIRADCWGASNWHSERMLAVASGYFVWDFFTCLYNVKTEGWAYVGHGIMCCCVYSYGLFGQTYHLYGAILLAWELSTPFVQLRWLLKLLGLEDGKLYYYNGIMMLLMFFLVRIVLGYACSIHFFYTGLNELFNTPPAARHIPTPWLLMYMGANAFLNGLNTNWFLKMVNGALKLLRKQKAAAAKKAE